MARGTAVAMHVSTVIASQIIGATADVSDALIRAEAKLGEYYHQSYEYRDMLTNTVFVFAIMILLIMFYFLAKCFFRKKNRTLQSERLPRMTWRRKQSRVE